MGMKAIATALFALALVLSQSPSAYGGGVCNVCLCHYRRTGGNYPDYRYTNYTVPGVPFSSDSQCHEWCAKNHPVKMISLGCNYEGPNKCYPDCGGAHNNCSRHSGYRACRDAMSSCPFDLFKGSLDPSCESCYQCLCSTQEGKGVMGTINGQRASPSVCEATCKKGNANGTVPVSTGNGCHWVGHRVGECLGHPNCPTPCTYSHGACSGNAGGCSGVYCACPSTGGSPRSGCGL